MRARNGTGSTTSAICHSRMPAPKNMLAPTVPMMTAVPRLGSFSTRATGSSTMSAGGTSSSGLPILR